MNMRLLYGAPPPPERDQRNVWPQGVQVPPAQPRGRFFVTHEPRSWLDGGDRWYVVAFADGAKIGMFPDERLAKVFCEAMNRE